MVTSLFSAMRSLVSRPARLRSRGRSACIDSLESRLLCSATPVLSVAGKGASEANAAGSAFTFSRSGPTTDPLDVAYSISGTATDTADYAHLTGTVHFAAGARTAVVQVLPVDDQRGEGLETVIATILADAAFNISPTKGAATITIADNEPVVSIQALDAKAKESGDPATDKATFKITRTGSLTHPLVVHFSASGTAGGGDYDLNVAGVPITNTVTIPAGVASVTINAAPVDDVDAESGETLILTLVPNDVNNPAYSILAAKSGAGVTINDNDSVPTVSLASGDDQADESGGAGTFTFSRAGGAVGDLIVSFQRAGTAKSADYQLYLAGTNTVITGKTVTIPDGQASVTLELRAIDDATPDANETATLKLVGKPTYNLAAGVANQVATVTIGDNEPTVSITAIDANAAEPGTDIGTFRIARTGSTFQSLDIKFKTSGEAVANKDYQTLGNIVTIPAGESYIDLNVFPLIDILANEDDETLTLLLSAGTGFSVDPQNASATVTIEDADLIPSGADIVPVSVVFARSSASISDPGTMKITATVTNFGTLTATNVHIYVYLIKQHDPFGEDWVTLGHFYGANGGYDIAAGASKTVSASTTFSNLDPGEEGEYFLLVDVYANPDDINTDNDHLLSSHQFFTVVS